jgi:hypothetical protein
VTVRAPQVNSACTLVIACGHASGGNDAVPVAERRTRRRARAKLMRSGSMSAPVAAVQIRELIANWTSRNAQISASTRSGLRLRSTFPGPRSPVLSWAFAVSSCRVRPAGQPAGLTRQGVSTESVRRERWASACGGAAFVFERCTSRRRGKTALTQLEQRVAAGEATLDQAAEVTCDR